MPTEEDCPDAEWRATPSLTKGTLETPECPTIVPGSGGSGGSGGDVTFGCNMEVDEYGAYQPDVAAMAGTSLTTEVGVGGCLKFAVDLVPADYDDEVTGDTLDNFLVSGDYVRIERTRLTFRNVYNAAGLPIDRYQLSAVASDLDLSRCSISLGCTPASPSFCIPPGGYVVGGSDPPDYESPPGGYVAGGSDPPDYESPPGGYVFGSTDNESFCESDAYVPITVTSVTGDGTSGGNSGGAPPEPYELRFIPVLSGGGLPGGCQPTFYWTFDGGSPATSTDHEPFVSFSAAGSHAFTLVVTDCCGNVTDTFNGSITVN